MNSFPSKAQQGTKRELPRSVPGPRRPHPPSDGGTSRRGITNTLNNRRDWNLAVFPLGCLPRGLQQAPDHRAPQRLHPGCCDRGGLKFSYSPNLSPPPHLLSKRLLTLLLFRSGDIHPNPGPIKKKPSYICPVCSNPILKSQGSFLCNFHPKSHPLSHWVHLKCSNLLSSKNYSSNWSCSGCFPLPPNPNPPPTCPSSPASVQCTCEVYTSKMSIKVAM